MNNTLYFLARSVDESSVEQEEERDLKWNMKEKENTRNTFRVELASTSG